jgi:hypothetical protein
MFCQYKMKIFSVVLTGGLRASPIALIQHVGDENYEAGVLAKSWVKK